MVKERDAADWEKDWIRQEIESAVANSATAEQIDGVRRTMVDLLGLSYPQVKAIGAWKVRPDQGKLVLEPTKVASTPVNEIICVRELIPVIAEPNVAIEEEVPLQEQEDELTVEVGTTDSIIDNQRVLENTSIEIVTDREEDEVDYDYPEKKEWRRNCLDFIRLHLPESERKKAKVLCLCATEWHEVEEIYDPLGIPRENVWGAEFNPDLQSRAAKRANELGTHFFPGRVEDLLSETDINFSIVILDLKQWLTVKNKMLTSLLPINPTGCVVITNFQRRRERETLQTMLKAMHLSKRRNKLGEGGWSLIDKIGDALDADEDEKADLKTVLDDDMDSQVLGDTGIFCKKNWAMKTALEQLVRLGDQLGDRANERMHDGHLLSNMMLFYNPEVLEKMQEALARAMIINESDQLFLMRPTSRIVDHAALNSPIFDAVSEYRYKSPKGTPFVSHMGHCTVSVAAHARMQSVATFIFEGMKLVAQDLDLQITIEDMQRNIIDTPRTAFKGDERFVMRSEGKMISSVSWSKWTDAIRQFRGIMDKDVWNGRNGKFSKSRRNEG